MPCSDGRIPHDNSHLGDEISMLRQRNTELAQMLCRICAEAEKANVAHIIEGRLTTWWAEHKAVDAKRLQAEKAQKAEVATERLAMKRALDKLSDDDKRALGI